jgi:hypothetical protein
MRAGLLGFAAGLGTMLWLASLAFILWRLPLGIAADYVMLAIIFWTLPLGMLVGAVVYGRADQRGRGPTDAPPVRRRYRGFDATRGVPDFF